MARDSVNLHDGPMHEWFSLSYANYLVLPRSLIQEMPIEWQERMARCLNEINDTFDCAGDYTVQLRDEATKRFVADPLAAYRRPDAQAVEARRKAAA